jgi:hypothetical protein
LIDLKKRQEDFIDYVEFKQLQIQVNALPDLKMVNE